MLRPSVLVLAASLAAAVSGLAQVPDPPDLLLWIGEGSGTTAANDLSGASSDGALPDGAKWVPG